MGDPATHFADALIERVRWLGHPLCVGLDPHLGRIPPLFLPQPADPADPDCAAAVEAFLGAVVDRLEGRVALVKPQIALFEQLGWRGLKALEAVAARARSRGLFVLLDAKRGDIASSAEGYARAYLGPRSSLEADALTVNPLLGLDTLEPYLKFVREEQRGIFVLVRTSNPGAGDFQERPPGFPLFETLARALAGISAEYRGARTGWSSVGAVVGANRPVQAERVREILPHALFLVPGFGAQGGGARDALRGFVPGPDGLEGGVVNSSRGVLFPDAGATDDASVWESAVDAALDAAVSQLGEAVSR